MFKTPATRLSLVLVLLTVNLLFLADLMGLVPDASESVLELRKSLSESLAFQFSEAAKNGELQTIQNTIRAVVQRNDNIRSAAIRTADGKLLALAGEHLAHWKKPVEGKSTATHVHVPVYRGDDHWATVEIRFAPLWTHTVTSGFNNSFMALLGFIALSSFLCYFFVIKRTLRELDPTAVIPERVQKAFDVLQEGVVILDEKEQIVMANKAIADLLYKSPAAMIGLKGSELGWLECRNKQQMQQLPWLKVMREGKDHEGAMLSLLDKNSRKIKLSVNAAMITDGVGKCRGTLLTFGDMTELEEKNFELGVIVEQLQVANDEIQAKSQELETLANHDPLTLCLNRRSLAQRLAVLFKNAKQHGEDLSCIMLDIDFFKSVNDRYGHATGDQVIKAVADILKTCTRDNDLVGRYGGEEFCLVLSNLYLGRAAHIAERIRKTIAKTSCSGVNVTASLGVSSLEETTNKPDELINQADKALYAAKKGGRNRVVTWGDVFNVATDIDDDHDIQEHLLETEIPKAESNDTKELQRRVLELEGLLEKRTIELEHYEMYDFKTGLPTRSLFEDRIGHEVSRGKRLKNLVAVLSMTIDTIKRVHETLGYRAAEQLVKACGQRLHDVLRENIDMVAVIDKVDGVSTVSLINQTEFGILLTDIKQVDHVTWVMKRLLDAFEQPFKIKGNEIYATAYFGVSIFPNDGKTADELYSSATNACSYAMKHNGEDRYMFASRRLNEMAVKQLKVENSLHEAIQKDELKLQYQPKIEAATGRIAGFEALLRWNSPRLGLVPPEEFIEVAERSGQIDAIGNWVLQRVCAQLRQWMDAGLDVMPIAVNISGVQLRQQHLARQIQTTLTEYHIDTDLLEIELTESSLVNVYDTSFTSLKEIRKMGIKVTMDDFGTGYSSFSYLREIPLSGLKIDRSFIADVHKDESADKLIASIVSIGHGLGLEVIAEGIEEKYQADHLIAMGCEYLQGYYYSRPISHGEVANLLEEQQVALTG